MSASKHTPGPWTPKPTPHSQIQDWVVLGAAVNGHSKRVCSIDFDAPESDARLIAAAPDLLAALELLADYAEAEVRGHDESVPAHLRCISAGQMAEAVIAARAAIAKATQ